MTDRRPEGGYVLIVVLVLLMAVTATGHSLLVLSRAELSVAVAHWTALTRRLAAEGGVRVGARGIPRAGTIPADTWSPVAEGRVPPRARYSTTALRLSPEIVLVRSEGRSDPLPGAHAVLGTYWGMDPEARVGAATAVVESGGDVILSGGSRIDAGRIRSAPTPWPESRCAEYRPGLDTLFRVPPPPWADLAGPALGSDPEPRVEDLELPSLGLLDHGALLDGASLRASGLVSPTPRGVGGGCDRASALNWGAPLNPLDPCASYRPVVVSEGSLTMEGGVGQGLLLVVGDAVVSSGANYYGMVLVAGDLSVRSGARINGLLRVTGSVRLEGGSSISGSACAALAALESAHALQGLIALPEGFWLDDSY